MTVTFLEPGGDATFTNPSGSNDIWNTSGATIATDFVHGNHIKSISYPSNGYVNTPSGTLSDNGSRISFYLYIATLPTASAYIANIMTSAPGTIVRLYLTSSGVLQLWRGAAVEQMGLNGSTLSTGVWYRISIAYKITSSSINEFRIFKNGVIDITSSNTASMGTASDQLRLGNFGADATLSIRTSDHYIDNSSSLKDTGDIWVTAKRPFSNGTTNNFSTQIGSGNSGYGSGHADEVNERALSTTNGWSMVGAGSAVTEEYNIEGASIGDIDISSPNFAIVDYMGWVSAKSLVSETGQIVVNGVSTPISLTSTDTIFKKFANSNIYPTGTGADIGITTDTTLTTVSLYECGIIVAYRYASPGFITNNLKPYSFSPGNAR